MPTVILDITLPISERLPVWPGDPQVTLVHLANPGEGMPAVSHIELGSHTGTHVDPPAHFIPDGITADKLPLDTLLGRAWVVRVSGTGPITAAVLSMAAIPAGTTRLLIRTDNSDRLLTDSTFRTDFVGLAPDAAAWLLDREVKLVGIDGASIEPYEAPGNPVHRALLGAGVVILEGLALAGVPPGPYQLICLPLKIADGDGAPARAILVSGM